MPAHQDVTGRMRATLTTRIEAVLSVNRDKRGCRTDDMPLIHRVFNREFGLLPAMEALDAAVVDRMEA